jgi:hypothetical protein
MKETRPGRWIYRTLIQLEVEAFEEKFGAVKID